MYVKTYMFNERSLKKIIIIIIKAAKYHPLLTYLRTEYTNIDLVNLSMSALGI